MIRKVRFVLCVAVLFVLQTALVHRFTHRFLRPDLLYLVAIFLALEAGSSSALWSAFALGLLRDLGSCGRLGASAILFVAATGGLLFLRDRLVRESVWMDLVLAFAYVLLCGTAYAAAVAVFAPGARAAELLPRALGQAVFTTALSPMFFAVFEKVGLVDRSAVSS